MSVKNQFLSNKQHPQATLNIYNLQAIEILEKAGIGEPDEQQIRIIERLLKATKYTETNRNSRLGARGARLRNVGTTT